MRNLHPPESNANGSANGHGADPSQHREQAAPLKFSAIASILWRRLWLILLCTLLTAGAGWLFVRNATPLYKSTAKIYIDRTGPVLVHRNDDPDMLLKADNFRGTQAEIIKSLAVITKVKNNPTVVADDTLADIPDPVSYIKQGLETKVDENDLLDISFEGKKPEEAAKIANAIVDSYLDYVAEQRHSTTADVLKILEKEKEKQDLDFSDRLKKLTDYRAANGDVALGDKNSTNPIMTQLIQYTDALSKARLDLLESKAMLEAAQGLKDNTESLQQFLQTGMYQTQAVDESSKIRRIRDQIEEAQKTLEDAQQTFTKDHPTVLRDQERLTELQDDLAKAEQDFRGAVLLAMQQRIELSGSYVAKLENLVAQQRTIAQNINSGLAEFERLQEEFAQSKQMIETLNTRIKELNIGDEAGDLNVRVIEPAVQVEEPSWPNKVKILRMCLAMGLLLGVVGALGLEMMDDRLRSAESATHATGLSVLSVVPATYKSDPSAMGKLVIDEPQSQFAEALRTLRTAIFFGTQEDKRKIILITSPLPGEGKSTLTANLAEALAQVGKKTILLDCDFRRPRVHQQFKLSNESGVSSVISGQESLAKAIHTEICKNLDVLTCGPTPPNPSELLNSEAMRNLLVELSAKYDHIVIDSPPVLAVSDARIIAASADVTLVVVRADQTRRKAARQAREHLDSVGANTLGIVINCAPRSTDRYGYGAGYGAYGYYDQAPRAKEPVGKD